MNEVLDYTMSNLELSTFFQNTRKCPQTPYYAREGLTNEYCDDNLQPSIHAEHVAINCTYNGHLKSAVCKSLYK